MDIMKVFDGHCDALSYMVVYGGGLRESKGQVDLLRMKEHGPWAQFFAIFGTRGYPDMPLEEMFPKQYEIFQRELAANGDLLVQCRTAEEIEAAWAAGKSAAILSVEGAELLGCSLEELERAYRLGVRAVNLTWNHANALSGSNDEEPEKGLTDQGRAFVRRMQELGMLVDVSHLSDPGFWDVYELSQAAGKPFFASHSNARAVCPHKRNLTDEQFTAIMKSGGVAGLNMSAEFLGEDPTVDTVVAHVEHWFGLGGEANVSLGGDWDGITHWPEGLDSIEDVHKLAERLLRMNYKEKQVEDLFCNNLMRVVRETCTM